MRLFPLLAALSLFGLAACIEVQPVRIPNAQVRQPGAPSVEQSELARRVHELVNAERAVRRLHPLRWTPRLARVAERHSEDMSRRGYFDHVSPEGRTPSDRAIRGNARCGRRVLENLAQTWLSRSETAVNEGLSRRVIYDWRTQEEIAEKSVTRWIQSPTHRAALFGASRKHGIGVVIRGDGHVVLTQVLC